MGCNVCLKVKKNPEASPAFHDDIEKRKEFGADENLLDSEFTARQKASWLFSCLDLALSFGVWWPSWYMNEISAIFLAMALLSGVVSGMNEKEIAGEFVKGIADFAFSAIVVGLARGILVIANNGSSSIRFSIRSPRLSLEFQPLSLRASSMSWITFCRSSFRAPRASLLLRFPFSARLLS